MEFPEPPLTVHGINFEEIFFGQLRDFAICIVMILALFGIYIWFAIGEPQFWQAGASVVGLLLPV